MKLFNKCAILAAACGSGLAGSVATAQNVLYNPGFEEPCSIATGFSTFGNVQNGNFFTTSGSRNVKMFGPFCCPLGYSGFFQDVPAAPGQSWEATAMVTSPPWDTLSWTESGTPGVPGDDRGSRVFITVDYLDANRQFLSGFQENRSSKLESNTDSQPIMQTVSPSVAPPGTAFTRITAYVEQADFVGGAAWYDDVTLNTVGGDNQLVNFSFEDAGVNCFGSPVSGWVNFGNGQVNVGQSPRTGDRAAKLFGGFSGSVAASGWFQNAGASGGTTWKASGWATSLANDLTQPGNDTFLTLEFFDASGVNISEFETHLSPYRSTGVATGAANDLMYTYFETLPAVAPEGTATVRCLIFQRQVDFAGGATWWDDMELIQTDARTCFADYDNSGGVGGEDVEAFFSDWSSGSTSADVDANGGVDGQDVEAFFLQWSAGGC